MMRTTLAVLVLLLNSLFGNSVRANSAAEQARQAEVSTVAQQRGTPGVDAKGRPSIVSAPLLLIDTTPEIEPVSTLMAPGNGNIGFGGPVGAGNIALDSNTSGDVRITYTRGGAETFDILVLYMDTTSGGEPNNSHYTDQGSSLRVAVSGLDGSNRAMLNFPEPMQAEFAIAYSASSGAALFRLEPNGSHQFVSLVASAGSSAAASVDFHFNLSSVGLAPGASFDFFGTYLSDTAFRSDEYVGPSVAAGNSGYTPVSLPAAQYVRFFTATLCHPIPCLFTDGFEDILIH